MTTLETYGTILLTIISLSTFGQKSLTGYYSSNVADIGFFVTRIQLNNDSTFKYEFSGDLMYNKGTGKYRIENKELIHLTFDADDSVNSLAKALSSNGKRPSRLFYKHGRIYEFNVNGQLVKHGQGMSRHKKFLLFGDRYLTTRKMYLKKRNGNLIWRGEENASR